MYQKFARNIQANQTNRRVRLQTITRLRWLAVAGQSITVAVVSLVLQFPLPLMVCALLIGALAAANIFLSARFPSTYRLGPRSTLLLLGFDVLQLAALLFITGGLTNPFAPLICVPVIISFASQPLRYSIGLILLAYVCVTLLAFSPFNIPWPEGEVWRTPPIMQTAIWFATIATMSFAAFYAYRVSNEANLLADALSATELVLEREKHLSQLDGLAAAAAHELGTPLATISLVAREMEREISSDDRFYEDVSLLRSQSERCRDILRRLTSLSADGEAHMRILPLSSLIEEVLAPHREFGISLEVVEKGEKDKEPVGIRNAGIMYGLGNLIENAIDYARKTVKVTVFHDNRNVSIIIEDDGPGYTPEILMRIGEPYMTKRTDDTRAGGLGLGLFIAKTLLERSGATISFGNRADRASGACVSVIWPRAVMDGGRPK